ncbi:DUF2254 domain-containing protein [Leisingera caerulea]|uniref:DUF2254 domain-containing protein n=1 Tax=Leisingera caerulea TaxID=506591 RepID=A0A9Q9HFC9_LEICA|nr:DUF2254 domain-containing protein [Leisingera caerulea]UWQ49142.1 DUF2254 domain-containing protein [Leisingera caerulea]UWQ53276.1 DUF2254 domain-containing protein [Leisingera caerulea]UWQ57856.1 DUF2254 domain-containing protein [Leisingera caerulea]
MIEQCLLYLRRMARKLWFRVVLISILSLLALLLAPLAKPLLPDSLSEDFGREAVLPVLTILASGMLAVTTFSLNVMVSAYRTAASMATPRVYRLLLEDTVTHRVLATFVGGFIYSLSGVILFRAWYYTPEGALVVFGITIIVVVLIVGAILRWIDHLSGLGSMDHTLRLIETRTRDSMRARLDAPCLGGQCADSSGVPADAVAIPAARSGFVRFAGMAQLDELAEEAGTEITLARAPGEYILRGQPVAWAAGGDNDFCKAASKAIDIGDVRSFDQDPSFGLTLLAETAQRALSPGINDPGTAIEVMGRLGRLLWENMPADEISSTRKPDFPNVKVPPVTARHLLRCAFPPIARCGSDSPSVMGWMHKSLEELEHHSNPEMAKAAAEMREELGTGGNG